MPHNSPTQVNQEILGLVSEVYASILSPERFVEVLELWDRNVSNDGEASDRMLTILEHQLSSAIPLLENSLREVVNKDELISRIVEYDRPSILISPNRMVVGSNTAGNELFNLYDGDRVDPELMGKLSQDKFNEITAKAADMKPDSQSFEVISFATRLPDGKTRENLVALRTVGLSTSKLGYVLVSGLDLLLSSAGVAAFQSSFGLTDAETRMVEALISGLRPKDIASQKGIREDTVKTHIRNIRDKTRMPTTSALVCLAASFAQVTTEHEKISERKNNGHRTVSNASNQTYVMPSQHKLVKVDGYNIEYVDFGPRRGIPIIILHSSMVGFILPPEFISELMSKGFRIIIPFRPGTGVSEQLKQSFSLEGMSAFLLKFADTLKLDKFALVGGTVGFAYAVKMASLQPGRVISLIGIAGYLPVDPKILNKSMARYQRGVLFTLQKSRPLAKLLVLSGYKMFLQLGGQRFFQQIMNKSKSDLAVVENANSVGVLSVGLRIAGAQGVEALLNDSFLVLHNWCDAVDELTMVAHLLHGDDDSVFKMDAVEAFCDEHPNFKLSKFENTGQLMIYARPRKIAQHIAAVIEEDLQKVTEKVQNS